MKRKNKKQKQLFLFPFLGGRRLWLRCCSVVATRGSGSASGALLQQLHPAFPQSQHVSPQSQQLHPDPIMEF